MELALVKQPSGILVPDRPPDVEFVRKVKAGEVLVGDFRRPRNGGHHRKLFALLQIMFENQERFENMEDMLVAVKIRVGHYSHHVTAEGSVVYIPRSISYGSLDQRAFEPFYESVVNLATSDPTFLRGLDADALEREIERRLNFM